MKEISNFENYFADRRGFVWSNKSGKFKKLNGTIQSNGYVVVGICGVIFKKKYVHRLILETFIGVCPEGMQCCHYDGDRTNNSLKNLRWDTRKNNQADAIRHGTHITGEKHKLSKLKRHQVDFIRCYPRTKGSGVFLAKKFGVSKSVISMVINRKHWNHGNSI